MQYQFVSGDPVSGLNVIDQGIRTFIAQHGDPSVLFIFVSHDVLACDAKPVLDYGLCFQGYHDALPLSSGQQQTFIYATYWDANSAGARQPDIGLKGTGVSCPIGGSVRIPAH